MKIETMKLFGKAILLLVIVASIIGAALAVSGCGGAYKQFAATTERKYAMAASYSADAASGEISMTFRPANPNVAPPASPVMAMNDEVIDRMLKVVEQAMAKSAKRDPEPSLRLEVPEVPKTLLDK